jgi:hypothetical protein
MSCSAKDLVLASIGLVSPDLSSLHWRDSESQNVDGITPISHVPVSGAPVNVGGAHKRVSRASEVRQLPICREYIGRYEGTARYLSPIVQLLHF